MSNYTKFLTYFARIIGLSAISMACYAQSQGEATSAPTEQNIIALQTGEWNGFFTTHQNIEAPAIFSVDITLNDLLQPIYHIGLKIFIDNIEVQNAQFENILVKENSLEFTLKDKACKLVEQMNGHYLGECSEPDNEESKVSYLEMIPPSLPSLSEEDSAQTLGTENIVNATSP